MFRATGLKGRFKFNRNPRCPTLLYFFPLSDAFDGRHLFVHHLEASLLLRIMGQMSQRKQSGEN